MMYSYGGVPLQQQQQQPYPQHQQPHVQHMSRPSPPQPTWAVPQTHNPYYAPHKSPVPPTREEQQRYVSRPDVTTTHSPALSASTFRPPISAADSLGTTDYFPGVIDTSEPLIVRPRASTNLSRSLGAKGMRGAGIVSIHGPRHVGV